MIRQRTEHDSMGEVQVPDHALYGAQTQRAVDNFQISDLRLPASFIAAVAQIKAAAALTNAELELLEPEVAEAIIAACDQIIAGEAADQFPVDLFQTGSGTSTNMNMNEVISGLIWRDRQLRVHPNDQVNMSQSSNDVIPTAIHLSALQALEHTLLPALNHLMEVLELKSDSLSGIVKTGRTHLMDAVPISLSQEVSAWAAQIHDCIQRLQQVKPRLSLLAQGGTAVGTGLNAPEGFPHLFAHHLRERTGLKVQTANNRFILLSSQDTALELSGQLKVCATALMKIANDLRWMNSGPLAGLGEIALPALQPGSSIMPGKVNPVISESVMMVAAQVMGNDTTVMICAQHGNFQLNTMLPLIAYNLLQSEMLLANSAVTLADKAIAGFTVNQARIEEVLARNPILVTALNSLIGYEKAAAVAKSAYQQGRPIIDVAAEETDISRARLQKLLDPMHLTGQE
ncbi:class II fumarate hydratase [Nitrincola alkalilacustris]|uniref:class II fumarate hydratase n=1 Tax=Nitrincola alkalilacustris TaxID=1571224 RepID=UPI00124EEC69|nr:class II fumarate hydratase [Nitrincola alkalilacustris]